jgi:hypothetical protein
MPPILLDQQLMPPILFRVIEITFPQLNHYVFINVFNGVEDVIFYFLIQLIASLI